MALTQINKAGLDELALDHVFTIGASGTDHYTFQGEGLNGTVNDPTLYLTRGKTYRFENGTGAHPIKIQSTSGASGTAYNTGVTNNAGSGTVIVEVQHDAPDVLYYQCTSHANMNGVLYITGALADGGVTTAKLADDAVTDAKLANSINTAISANTAKTTNATHTGDVTGSTSLTIANNAVTTAKIAADAINHTKIADDSIGAEHIIDGSVTTAKIADQGVTLAKLPHGDGSSDGKFLRANNGADPSFETVSLPDADRIIEGNSYAEILDTGNNGIFRFLPEGIEKFRIQTDGNVGIGTTSPAFKLDITGTGTANGSTLNITDASSSADSRHIKLTRSSAAAYIGVAGSIPNDPFFISRTGNNSDLVINSSGKVGIGTASPSQKLHLKDTAPMAQIESSSYSSFVGTAEANDNIGNGTKAGNLVLRGQTGISISGNGGTATQVKIDADGLKFGSDTAAANALDDYEEGTYTPTDLSGASLSLTNNNTARYTKIGRMVYVQFDITWPSTSNNADASFTIPFALQVSYGSGVVGWTDNGNPLVIHVGSRAYVMDNNNSLGSSSQHAKNNEISGKRLIGNFWYIG